MRDESLYSTTTQKQSFDSMTLPNVHTTINICSVTNSSGAAAAAPPSSSSALMNGGGGGGILNRHSQIVHRTTAASAVSLLASSSSATNSATKYMTGGNNNGGGGSSKLMAHQETNEICLDLLQDDPLFDGVIIKKDSPSDDGLAYEMHNRENVFVNSVSFGGGGGGGVCRMSSSSSSSVLRNNNHRGTTSGGVFGFFQNIFNWRKSTASNIGYYSPPSLDDENEHRTAASYLAESAVEYGGIGGGGGGGLAADERQPINNGHNMVAVMRNCNLKDVEKCSLEDELSVYMAELRQRENR